MAPIPVSLLLITACWGPSILTVATLFRSLQPPLTSLERFRRMVTKESRYWQGTGTGTDSASPIDRRLFFSVDAACHHAGFDWECSLQSSMICKGPNPEYTVTDSQSVRSTEYLRVLFSNASILGPLASTPNVPPNEGRWGFPPKRTSWTFLLPLEFAGASRSNLATRIVG
ncbi:hypothetical protein BDW72DRAFT_69264 [Aspergillus terricola var. indicus]